MVVSVVISDASSGGAFSELDNPVVQILFWLGLASAVYGMGLLVLAILPRFRNIGDRNRLAFFAHAAAFGEGPTGEDDVARDQVRRELGKALVAVATVSSLDRLTDRDFDISTIVLAKYRRVRWAMLSLALGAVLLARLVGAAGAAAVTAGDVEAAASAFPSRPPSPWVLSQPAAVAAAGGLPDGRSPAARPAPPSGGGQEGGLPPSC